MAAAPLVLPIRTRLRRLDKLAALWQTHGGQTMPQDLSQLARRLLWWKPPEEALKAPERLLAQVMTFGTWEDIQLAKQHWGMEAFRRVLLAPPPGVFDRRSWNYWHVIFGNSPTPPLPVREIPADV